MQTCCRRQIIFDNTFWVAKNIYWYCKLSFYSIYLIFPLFLLVLLLLIVSCIRDPQSRVNAPPYMVSAFLYKSNYYHNKSLICAKTISFLQAANHFKFIQITLKTLQPFTRQCWFIRSESYSSLISAAMELRRDSLLWFAKN